MDKKFSLFLLVILAAIFLQLSLARRGKSRCPWIDLQNGRVKIRSRGRVAKFRCRKGFTLFDGDRFATCVRNQWNGKIPKCIRQGCLNMAAPANGHRTYLYSKALVKFACDPGYDMEGSSALYCDAINWNGTAPNCTAPGNPALSCDFESPDLCGWTNARHDNFDWLRKRGPSRIFSTDAGPSADHTLGTVHGHYMFIEASIPREQGHRALLYSPVFSASGPDTLSCFSFYYHMYGANSGVLNGYLKPEGVSMEFLPPILQMTGSSHNLWLQHKFNLTNVVDNFQIILEAMRARTYSDIAIDDVQLAFGDDCKQHSTMPEVRPVTTTTTTATTYQSPNTTATISTTSYQSPDTTLSINLTVSTTPATNSSSSSSPSSFNATTRSTTAPSSSLPPDTTPSTTTPPLTTTLPITSPPTTTTPTTTSSATEANTTMPSTTTSHTTTSLTTTSPTSTVQSTVKEESQDTTTPEEDTGVGDDLQSCRWRCGEIALDEEACGCDIDCGKNSTRCCTDVTTYCESYLSTPPPINASLSTVYPSPSVSTESSGDGAEPTVPPSGFTNTTLGPSNATEDENFFSNATDAEGGEGGGQEGTTPTTLESSAETSPTTPSRPVTYPIHTTLSVTPRTLVILTESTETTLEQRTPKPTTSTTPLTANTTATAETTDAALGTSVATRGPDATNATDLSTTETGELNTTLATPSTPTAANEQEVTISSKLSTTTTSRLTTTETEEPSSTEATGGTTTQAGDPTTPRATASTTQGGRPPIRTTADEGLTTTDLTNASTTSTPMDSWTLTWKNTTTQISATNVSSLIPEASSESPEGGVKDIQSQKNETVSGTPTMSRGISGVIVLLVVLGVILTAVAVFLYVRRIRRQDRLPDDSDIRYLARDEVQMMDNISHIYSDGSRRGTPV